MKNPAGVRFVEVPAFVRESGMPSQRSDRATEERRAEKIRRAWAALGVTVEVEVVSGGKWGGDAVWSTISRTKNGVPV